MIRVTARRVSDRLELTVGDNGRGTASVGGLQEGDGLTNTRARLEHLSPGRNDVRFSTPASGGFIVTLSPAVAGDAGRNRSTGPRHSGVAQAAY